MKRKSLTVSSNEQMSTSLKLWLIPFTTALIITLLPVPSHAQNMGVSDTTSTPIGGVPHDYIAGLVDIVNPANGSLSIRIKANPPHERGVNWPSYVFMWDSNNQYGLTPSWEAGSTGTGSFTSLSGVSIISQYSQFGSTSTQQVTLPSGGGDTPTTTTYYCQISAGWILTDPDGGNHAMGLMASEAEASTANGCTEFPNAANNYLAGGDEQYKGILRVKNSAAGVLTPLVTVVDLHGDVVQTSSSGGFGAVSYLGNTAFQQPIVREDTNGNYMNSTGRTWSATQTSTGYTMTLPGVSSPYIFTTGTTPVSQFSVPVTNVDSTSGGDYCQVTTASTAQAGTGTPVKTIKLPDGLSYTFTYDPVYGLINSVTYPTGATVTYTWGLIANAEGVQYRNPHGTGNGGFCQLTYGWFAVTKRVVSYNGSSNSEEEDYSYNTTWPAVGGTTSHDWLTKQTTVTTKDLVRNTSYKTVYNYSPVAIPATADPISNWGDQGVMPQESTTVYDDASGNILKTVTKTWQALNLISAQCVTLPNNTTSGTFYTYQPDSSFSGINPNAVLTNLPTDVAEFDYGTVGSTCIRPSSVPARETETVYQSFGNTPLFGYPSILDRPQSVKVYGNVSGSQALLSETDYQYDQFPLAPVSFTNSVLHDETNYGPSVSPQPPRGNPTTITKECFIGSTSCTNSVMEVTYDTTGQVINTIDACGTGTCTDMNATSHTTTYSYTDSYTSDNGSPAQSTNAYVTQITRPATNGAAHINQYQYGFNDGKMRKEIDENLKQTTYCYITGGCSSTSGFDPFYRLTGVSYPDGGSTTTTYSDAGPKPTVNTSTAITSAANMSSVKVYDGYGHGIQSQLTSDPAGTVIVNTVYDGVGQTYSVSNAYRSTAEASYGVTSYVQDSLGRLTSETRPDGSTFTWCYDGVPTSSHSTCPANVTSVATGSVTNAYDGKGYQTQRISDALGRLIAVDEPSPSTGVASLETDYSYDGLGNLLLVNQKGTSSDTPRTSRSFTYNSLSQLLCASNPENSTSACPSSASWSTPTNTTAYTYDLNGNLQTKVDARGVVISYGYDALNRLLSKTYPAGTPSSCYQYDLSGLVSSGGNLIGRLTNTWTQNSGCPVPSAAPSSASAFQATNILSRHSMLSYDTMGRLLNEQQCTIWNCSTTKPYSPAYTYNLIGEVVTWTNGMGTLPGVISFTNTYDLSARLNLITSGSTSLYSVSSTGNSSPCVTGLQPGYSAAGGLMNAKFGSSLALSRTFEKLFRVNCEQDTGNQAGTDAGTATITITGTEQTQ